MLNKNKKRDIHDRIYNFALSVLNYTKIFPKTTENIILLKQVIRSSSSIGANASEADGAESKREAKETYYWLSLLKDHNPKTKSKTSLLLKENHELIVIISKVIINSKN